MSKRLTIFSLPILAPVLRDNDEEALLTFIEDNFVFNKVQELDNDPTKQNEDLKEDEFIAKVS